MGADVNTNGHEIHILHQGLPLCGFTRDVPRDWPTGHVWVRLSEADKANCRDCKAEAEKLSAKKK